MKVNLENVEAIREVRQNVIQKKKDIEEETKKQAKKRYLENIETEISKKDELEKRIKDLESKENELINALKNTNQLEMLAMEDLKKILNGEQFNGLLENSFTMNASVKSKK